MGRNSHYFVNRDEMVRKARNHIDFLSRYDSEIKHSIDNSVCYGKPFTVIDDSISSSLEGKYDTKISVCDLDSVSAVFKYIRSEADIAVLNFASFKNPGGKFLEGSKAQEECLCHESTLYPVLVNFDDTYYAVNRRDTNRALYYDRAIFTPDVIFMRDNKECKCSVITCAAPNRYAAQKYFNVLTSENIDALYGRIMFILTIAAIKGIKDLVLGAYGCGVFGQDPYATAKLFKYLIIDGSFKNVFDNVIFAIPNSGNDNYSTFKSILNP